MAEQQLARHCQHGWHNPKFGHLARYFPALTQNGDYTLSFWYSPGTKRHT